MPRRIAIIVPLIVYTPMPYKPKRFPTPEYMQIKAVHMLTEVLDRGPLARQYAIAECPTPGHPTICVGEPHPEVTALMHDRYRAYVFALLALAALIVHILFEHL